MLDEAMTLHYMKVKEKGFRHLTAERDKKCRLEDM